MQTKTEEKRKHNSKTYNAFIVRVRKDSELAALLENYKKVNEYSLNLLICSLLSDFFNCPLPHREYTHTKRERII